jgi:hypothetical protein
MPPCKTLPEHCTCTTHTLQLILFCPEHSGAWSYKCRICWEHLRILEEKGITEDSQIMQEGTRP